MIEPRLYRAAFLPALLALIVAAFSLEDRPAPLPQALAADVLFQGKTATMAAKEIAKTYPDRRPGSVGDRAEGRQLARTFAAHGFTTVIDHFSSGSGTPLDNVIGRRAGASRHQIVVVAPRDAGSIPDATGSASDTAALAEIARVLQGTPSRKTITLASVDGSTLGELGIHRLLDKLPDRRLIETVIVLSNLGAPGPHVPPLQIWSNDSQRVGVGLERTASLSESEEFGREPHTAGAPAQMIRLAFPLGVGAQGPLLAAGEDTVRFSGSGELPAAKDKSGVDSISPDRLGSLGRAALRTVFAVDQNVGPPARGPTSYVTVAGNLLPQWAVALVAMSLILPALVASIDGFARARRRHEPVGRYARWVLAGVLALVTGLVIAKLMVVVGIVADPPESPVAPDVRPVHGGDVAVMAVLAAVVAAAWMLGRRIAVGGARRRLDLAAPGAGCAVALAVSCVTLAVWFINPFAALMLVPALHLWLLAAMARVPDRGPVAPALVVVGLLPLAVVVLYYMSKLSLGPLGGLWYAFLLVTSGTVGIAAALFACAFIGVFGCLVAVLVARARRPPVAKVEEPKHPAVFGPGGYAGPGALGGTESALRR
ncbi:MAG TPA: hypothetical protein VGI67_17815 [Thermoleophilaceae bacterium]